MDPELEEQIDEIVQKAMRDLKTKILKVVVKNQTKLAKEHAKELKNNSSTSKQTKPRERSPRNTRAPPRKEKEKEKESDGEYSE